VGSAGPVAAKWLTEVVEVGFRYFLKGFIEEEFRIWTGEESYSRFEALNNYQIQTWLERMKVTSEYWVAASTEYEMADTYDVRENGRYIDHRQCIIIG